MKVLVTDHGFPHLDIETDVLRAAGHELSVAPAASVAGLIAAGRDADALLVQFAPVPAAVIDALERCRVIVRYGIGYDNVDLAAAGRRGIPVCNVPDYCIDEVADHSLALALSLARRLPQTDAALRAGGWKIMPPTPFPALRDSVFATAGFGRIARAVLSRAAACGFRVAAYDPFVADAEFAAAGVRRLTEDELWAEADVLSLHLPLTAETKHWVNATTLARLPAGAVIVNTARGALIDTVALAAALHEGRLGGAGLDVYETEPLPADHPLRAAPHTVLTSHTAWYSAASIPRLQRKAAENVVRALAGYTPHHIVNRAQLSPATP
jgi:D-3-phosphoglycerate dehydrogenase / 2-oxoglutarate reductase